MIIGQDKLLDKFNKFTLSTLPHSVMLIGDYGCGKHSLCEYVASKFNLNIKDISDNLDAETINSIYDTAVPQLYIIDGKNITLKEESTILKFIEEPSKSAYIFILCENKGKMLNTILNRCVIFEFNPYTNEDLMKISSSNSELLFSVANTPGKVLKWENNDIEGVFALCNKIIDRIPYANVANALSISKYINIKGTDTDKYDKDLFLSVLSYCSYHKVIENNDKMWYNIYVLTNKFINDCYIPHIDFMKLFEHYIICFKELSKVK